MNQHDAIPETYRLEIQRLREIIAHNSDWLWEVDAQGRYTFCSEHSQQLLGYAPHEILGRTPFDFMPPEEAERVGAEFAGIVAEQRPFSGLINRNVRADGRLVVLETSGIPLFDEAGQLRGYRGIDRDITPAIGPLNPRLVQLEALYAAASVALGLIDREGRFVNANHALTRLLSEDQQPLVGQPVGAFLAPEELDLPAAFACFEANETLADLEITRSGRHFQATLQAVHDHDGRLLGLTLAITDVTEQHRMRRQLADANAQLAQANARLSELAETDYLTGLPNRRRFDESLVAEVSRAMREGWSLSLLILDVDLFKAYNDHYGHQAGDDCLRTVARLLREGLFRPADLACRYGGEEFAVILPHADASAAAQVAERLRRQLRAAALPHALAPARQLTASIGIATLHGQQASATAVGLPGETAAHLLKVADHCLYAAKRGGRNQISTATL